MTVFVNRYHGGALYQALLISSGIFFQLLTLLIGCKNKKSHAQATVGIPFCLNAALIKAVRLFDIYQEKYKAYKGLHSSPGTL